VRSYWREKKNSGGEELRGGVCEGKVFGESARERDAMCGEINLEKTSARHGMPPESVIDSRVTPIFTNRTKVHLAFVSPKIESVACYGRENLAELNQRTNT